VIPDSFIQDLLARVDIVDLVDSYVPLKKAGANYAACCPFHNEKSPSFTVSPTKQFYHCFGCGAHGTAISFVMEYQGMGFVDAVKELAGRAGMSVPESEGRSFHDEKPGQTRTLIEVMARAAAYYKAQLKASPRAIDYCKKRGLSGEVAARFGIGYAPDGWQNLQAVFADYNADELKVAGLVIENEAGRRYDRFRDRLMIPIVNPGEIIAFGGRIIDQGEPKYLNSPETPLFEKGRELFGLPQARQALRETNTAIVTEGYMDVIALSQNGVGNAVATLGTATTPTHVQKLLRQVDRIVFCFDGDNAGRKAAWRALENAWKRWPTTSDRLRLPARRTRPGQLHPRIRQGSSTAWSPRPCRCPTSCSRTRPALRPDQFRRQGAPDLRSQAAAAQAADAAAAPATGQTPGRGQRFRPGRSGAPVRTQVLHAGAAAQGQRTAPSLTRNLLRIVLHKPQLARQLPIDLLPDTPSARR
jgi:DNA primase